MYLLKECKITLLKCTICNLSKYFMSLLPTAANVAIHIEKLQRDFLLMGLGEELSWEKSVCLCHSGGLDVRKIIVFNDAFLEFVDA